MGREIERGEGGEDIDLWLTSRGEWDLEGWREGTSGGSGLTRGREDWTRSGSEFVIFVAWGCVGVCGLGVNLVVGASRAGGGGDGCVVACTSGDGVIGIGMGLGVEGAKKEAEEEEGVSRFTGVSGFKGIAGVAGFEMGSGFEGVAGCAGIGEGVSDCTGCEVCAGCAGGSG